MPIQIRRADLYSYVVGALERDVAEFRLALAAHAHTVGEAAPTAVHALVEALARSPDGTFLVAEDVAEEKRRQEPQVTANDIKLLLNRIVELEARSPPPGDYSAIVQRVREAEGKLLLHKAWIDELLEATGQRPR